MKKNKIVQFKTIKRKIYTVRGLQIMLDQDLAELYRVETRVFNQAVKRNIERFPKEFMFQITSKEHDSLRSQIVTLKKTEDSAENICPMFLQSKAFQCLRVF